MAMAGGVEERQRRVRWDSVTTTFFPQRSGSAAVAGERENAARCLLTLGLKGIDQAF